MAFGILSLFFIFLVAFYTCFIYSKRLALEDVSVYFSSFRYHLIIRQICLLIPFFLWWIWIGLCWHSHHNSCRFEFSYKSSPGISFFLALLAFPNIAIVSLSQFFYRVEYFGERFDHEVPLNVEDEYEAYNASRHEDLEFDFGKLQDIELEEVDLDYDQTVQTE